MSSDDAAQSGSTVPNLVSHEFKYLLEQLKSVRYMKSTHAYVDKVHVAAVVTTLLNIVLLLWMQTF